MSIKTFDNMIGKIFVRVENLNHHELRFTTANGSSFWFEHIQDCCEDVHIEDVIGDLSDLEDSPLVLAEEVSEEELKKDPYRTVAFVDNKEYHYGTWTFYRFGTNKGTVTVRWFGESNGYYSERVDYFENYSTKALLDKIHAAGLMASMPKGTNRIHGGIKFKQAATAHDFIYENEFVIWAYNDEFQVSIPSDPSDGVRGLIKSEAVIDLLKQHYKL